MVDVSLLQQLSYITAAIGVCLAAIYYVMVLKTQEKTRRIQLVTQLSRELTTTNGNKNYFTLLNMEWEDYDDFERKYGSDANIEAAAMRYAAWGTYDHLGYMLKTGMINADDLWVVQGLGTIYQWTKWEPIIIEQRRRYNGEDWMQDFEYLAREMSKIKANKDPSFKIPETFAKYIQENT